MGLDVSALRCLTLRCSRSVYTERTVLLVRRWRTISWNRNMDAADIPHTSTSTDGHIMSIRLGRAGLYANKAQLPFEFDDLLLLALQIVGHTIPLRMVALPVECLRIASTALLHLAPQWLDFGGCHAVCVKSVRVAKCVTFVHLWYIIYHSSLVLSIVAIV